MIFTWPMNSCDLFHNLGQADVLALKHGEYLFRVKDLAQHCVRPTAVVSHVGHMMPYAFEHVQDLAHESYRKCLKLIDHTFANDITRLRTSLLARIDFTN